MYHRNFFRSSSKVFGNLRQSSDIFGNSRKMFGSVRPAFGTILKFLRKSSEGGRKSSGNHQKCRHQHVYIIKRTLHGGLKIIILFLVAKTIFYERAQRVSKILFCNSKIKFISSRPRVISSIYFTYESRDTLANARAQLLFSSLNQTFCLATFPLPLPSCFS